MTTASGMKSEAVDLVNERDSPTPPSATTAVPPMTAAWEIKVTTTPRTERLAAGYHAITGAVAALRHERRGRVAFTVADCENLAFEIRDAIGNLYDEISDLIDW